MSPSLLLCSRPAELGSISPLQACFPQLSLWAAVELSLLSLQGSSSPLSPPVPVFQCRSLDRYTYTYYLELIQPTSCQTQSIDTTWILLRNDLQCNGTSSFLCKYPAYTRTAHGVLNNIVYYFKCNQNNSSYRNYKQLWHCVISSRIVRSAMPWEDQRKSRWKTFLSPAIITKSVT